MTTTLQHVLVVVILFTILLLLKELVFIYRRRSSYKKMVELAKRWKTHPEEFLTLEELEKEVLKDWEFNNERD